TSINTIQLPTARIRPSLSSRASNFHHRVSTVLYSTMEEGDQPTARPYFFAILAAIAVIAVWAVMFTFMMSYLTGLIAEDNGCTYRKRRFLLVVVTQLFGFVTFALVGCIIAALAILAMLGTLTPTPPF
ncbi:hypothetical protein GGR57DRAFT_520896, partial [Xylariaceae sp. FL1272]